MECLSTSGKEHGSTEPINSTWPPLANMLTQRVEVGREECSRQDRISALKANFPSFMLKTYTVLVAIFSWAINTCRKQNKYSESLYSSNTSYLCKHNSYHFMVEYYSTHLILWKTTAWSLYKLLLYFQTESLESTVQPDSE